MKNQILQSFTESSWVMSRENKQSTKKNHNITIVDVARDSGVSYSTVSRVLNGYEYVKESTRERVLASAEKLGYVANLQARSLAGGKMHVVGLLVPGLDNGYIAEIVRGADDELFRSDYNMMLYTTHRYQGKESEYVKSIYSGLTDGLLLLVPLTTTSYLDALQAQNFPYVLIDQADSTNRSNIVDSTNWQGAYDATNYLIGLGHRKIAHITGLMGLSSATERLEGYKAALTDHNISVDENYILHGDFYQHLGYTHAQTLVNMSERPTAIFAANDLTAIGVMEAVREFGLSIPEDLSIIGFDDIPQSVITYPKLTTMHQSLEQMGRVAVQLLLEQIENPERPARRMTLATRLVERESCREISVSE